MSYIQTYSFSFLSLFTSFISFSYCFSVFHCSFLTSMGCVSSDENDDAQVSVPNTVSKRSSSHLSYDPPLSRMPISRTPPGSRSRPPLQRSETMVRASHRRSITHLGVEYRIENTTIHMQNSQQVLEIPVIIMQRSVNRLDVPLTPERMRQTRTSRNSRHSKPKTKVEDIQKPNKITPEEIEKWEKVKSEIHARYESNRWRQRSQSRSHIGSGKRVRSSIK